MRKPLSACLNREQGGTAGGERVRKRKGEMSVHSRRREDKFQLRNNTGLEKLSSCPEKNSREIF